MYHQMGMIEVNSEELIGKHLPGQKKANYLKEPLLNCASEHDGLLSRIQIQYILIEKVLHDNLIVWRVLYFGYEYSFSRKYPSFCIFHFLLLKIHILQ